MLESRRPYSYSSQKKKYKNLIDVGLYKKQEKTPFKDPMLEWNRNADLTRDQKPELREKVYAWMQECLAHGITPSSKDWHIERGRKWKPLIAGRVTHLNTGLLYHHSLKDLKLGFKKTGKYSSVFILKMSYSNPRQLYFCVKMGFKILKANKMLPSLIYRQGKSYYFYYSFNESIEVEKAKKMIGAHLDRVGFRFPKMLTILPDGNTVVPFPFGIDFEAFERTELKRLSSRKTNGLNCAINFMRNYHIYDKFADMFDATVYYDPQYIYEKNLARKDIKFISNYNRRKRRRPLDTDYTNINLCAKELFGLKIIPQYDMLRDLEDYIVSTEEFKSFSTRSSQLNFIRFSLLLISHFYQQMHTCDLDIYPIPSTRLKSIYSNYKPYLTKFISLFSKKIKNYWNGSYNRHCNIYCMKTFKDQFNKILYKDSNNQLIKSYNQKDRSYDSIPCLHENKLNLHDHDTCNIYINNINTVRIESPLSGYVFEKEHPDEGRGPP